MTEEINPEDIRENTSLRDLKLMRKKLKKNRNQPFTLRLIETRIKQLQHQHGLKANHDATNRIIKFLQKVTHT